MGCADDLCVAVREHNSDVAVAAIEDLNEWLPRLTAVAALPSTEVLKQSVASMTTEVSTHLRKVAEDSSSKLIDLARRLEQLEQGTRAALDGVASQNKVTFSALQQLKKEFEESDKLSRDKLVALERLARRSLFAILMGRDPDQNK